MSSFQQQERQDEMIDIQDKIGYVDTGPISSRQQQQQPIKTTVVSSSTSHLTIKEPKPQNQVHILLNKHHRTKPPEIQQENKVSFHSTTKPILKRSNSIEQPSSSSSLSPLNVSQQQRTMKGKERQVPPSVSQDPASSSLPSVYMTQNRDELKDMMVSKLYELADMLKSLKIDEHHSPSQMPRPTPSKSDPAYNPHYQYQPLLRRKPSKVRFVARQPQYPSPPDHQQRQNYNKSADHVQNYQEPTNVHNHRSNNAYPNMRYNNNNDGYYNPPSSYYPPQQLEEEPYDDYYYHQEDPYSIENTPIDYYMIQPPPPQQYYERGRRKSFGHFHEGASLHRKSSRSNLRRSRQPVMFDARYDSYPSHQQAYAPSYYPHQYSPNDGYFP